MPAPERHGLGIEDVQALEAEVPHPSRLAFHFRDFLDDLAVQTLAGLEDEMLVFAEIVFVNLAEEILGLCLGVGCHWSVETPGVAC